MSKLCTRFDKHQVILLGLIFSLLCSNLTFIVQISLVPNQNNNYIVSSFGSDVINPLFRILERLCIYRNVRRSLSLFGFGMVLIYWKCHRQQLQHLNRGCTTESSFGIALVQQYPIIAIVPFGLPDTQSVWMSVTNAGVYHCHQTTLPLIRNRYRQWPGTCCRKSRT